MEKMVSPRREGSSMGSMVYPWILTVKAEEDGPLAATWPRAGFHEVSLLVA